MVSDKKRSIATPLKCASMQEKETFVIFDEARSRGSDMKLLPESAAVLTLGLKITKDKLLQGAGRMRQLGCNQTLCIASFDEVAQSVLQTSAHAEVPDLTTIDVLNWVMDNTKTESVQGLLEWAGNGLHFRRSQHNESAEWVNEDWSLEMLYADKRHPQPIAEIIDSKARLGFENIDDDIVSQICSRGRTYGLDDELFVTTHTGECERELQVENEVQHEQEVELEPCVPAAEKIWDYAVLLRKSCSAGEFY